MFRSWVWRVGRLPSDGTPERPSGTDRQTDRQSQSRGSLGKFNTGMYEPERSGSTCHLASTKFTLFLQPNYFKNFCSSSLDLQFSLKLLFYVPNDIYYTYVFMKLLIDWFYPLPGMQGGPQHYEAWALHFEGLG